MLNPNAFTLVYFVMVTVPLTDYIVDRRCVTREKVSPKDLYPTAQLAFHVDQGPPWAESQVESTSRKAGDDISVFNEGGEGTHKQSPALTGAYPSIRWDYLYIEYISKK